MKKSSRVTLTAVAAIGLAARAQPAADPCQAATFNEQACHEAVRHRGYCWNGSWVHMRYSYPYPYYYDRYQAYAALVGPSLPAEAGACGPVFVHRSGGSHFVATRHGFGSTCHGHAGG